MEANVAPRPVDFIRGKCPGPVTLHVSLRKRLLALALSVCATALFAYIWIVDPGPQHRWYDWFMLPFAVFLFGVFTIRAMILLLAPRAACLTLDVHGFEVCGVFLCRRTAWQDASGFRVEKTGRDRHLTVMYDVLAPGEPKTTGALPDNDALPADDLAWLMEQWREEALAHQSLPYNALRG